MPASIWHEFGKPERFSSENRMLSTISGRDNSITFNWTLDSTLWLPLAAERHETMTQQKPAANPIPSRHEAFVDRGAKAGDEIAIEARLTSSNPLDFVPDEIPFDVPY